MHCNRRDFVVWMTDLCSKCPLIGFHKIQTKEIKCRQFSPSPCLFAEPEALSKHSVSLWIGYSVDDICSQPSCKKNRTSLIPSTFEGSFPNSPERSESVRLLK